MRWRGSKQSNNIDDRTGGGGGSGLPSGNLVKGGGIGTIIVLALVFLFSGGDLSSVLNSMSPDASPATAPQTQSAEMVERKEFVSVVFAHLEDFWEEEFANAGKSYQQPTMVFFSGNVRTACGPATSAVGPFYCPGDQDVYLDLSFMDELATDFNASGDFAMAYVVAHEVGHHVQQQLGVSKQVQSLRNKLSEAEYNQYQVKMELQADYYAGAWAKYIAGQTFEGEPILEIGDIDEALTAANSIGDDTLQMQAQGYVVPERYTHGTSKQRKSWFTRGYQYGDFEHGDTFNTANLDL